MEILRTAVRTFTDGEWELSKIKCGNFQRLSLGIFKERVEIARDRAWELSYIERRSILKMSMKILKSSAENCLSANAEILRLSVGKY